MKKIKVYGKEYIGICFVCTANMSRSIMAQIILSETTKDIDIISCGTNTITGYPPTTKTIKVLSKYGYNTKSFVSTRIEDLNLENHLIISMTSEHKKFLKKSYSLNSFTFSDLVDVDFTSISDPVKGDINAHIQTFEIIKRTVLLFAEKFNLN